MNKNFEIHYKVKEHFNFLLDHYNEEQILGVFLYGSQNYDLDTENSDVDTKAIYIPTFEEVVFNKPVSVKYDLPNGECCEIKDIREIIKNFKKQNINFIEILFTDYFVLNPRYEEIWKNYFIEFREGIARYDIDKAIHSMTHQALHTLKQAMTSDDAEKKISNVIRLIYFINKYVCERPYKECIIPTDDARDFILNTKKGHYNSDEYFFGIRILETILEGYAEMDYSYLVDKDKQEEYDSLMKEAVLKLIKLNL